MSNYSKKVKCIKKIIHSSLICSKKLLEMKLKVAKTFQIVKMKIGTVKVNKIILLKCQLVLTRWIKSNNYSKKEYNRYSPS